MDRTVPRLGLKKCKSMRKSTGDTHTHRPTDCRNRKQRSGNCNKSAK